MAGFAHVLSFDLANSNGSAFAGNRFEALVDGVSVFSRVDLPQQNYVHHSVGFVAVGAQTSLTLQGYNAANFTALDAVSVSARCPNPASRP